MMDTVALIQPKTPPSVFVIEVTPKGLDIAELLDAIEYEAIDRALEVTGGVVHVAAKLLKMERSNFSQKMRKHGIPAWRFREDVKCKVCVAGEGVHGG